LPEGQIERFGKVVYDEHGHLHLGEIEFGRLMKELLSQRLEKLGIKMTFIDKDLGYELRCADPIPFDAEYTATSVMPPSSSCSRPNLKNTAPSSAS